MKKWLIILLVFTSQIALAHTSRQFYDSIEGGMFSAAWKANNQIQALNLTPTGIPKGWIGRFSVGYQANKYFSVEFGYTMFAKAAREFKGYSDTISMRTYDAYLRVNTPLLWRTIMPVAKVGVAYLDAGLTGAGLPPNVVNVWRPAFGIGFMMPFYKNVWSSTMFYRILGHYQVGDEQNIAGLTLIQPVPNINLFMGGLIIKFAL